jgi:hypothetical protein
MGKPQADAIRKRSGATGMRRTYRNRRRPASPQPARIVDQPQSPAMLRGESHRATYRMHHLQPSPIDETGSSAPELKSPFRIPANLTGGR